MHINTHTNNHKITQTGSPASSTNYISITKWSTEERAVDPPPHTHSFLFLALCYYLGFPALVIKVAKERQRQIIWWVGWLGRSAKGHYFCSVSEREKMEGCADSWIESKSEFDQKCFLIYDLSRLWCPDIYVLYTHVGVLNSSSKSKAWRGII